MQGPPESNSKKILGNKENDQIKYETFLLIWHTSFVLIAEKWIDYFFSIDGDLKYLHNWSSIHLSPSIIKTTFTKICGQA